MRTPIFSEDLNVCCLVPVAGLNVSTVFATNNKVERVKGRQVDTGEKIILETAVDNVFTDGAYTITCAIESDDFQIIYDRISYIHSFVIGGHKLAHATTHPKHEMHISYKNGKIK